MASRKPAKQKGSLLIVEDDSGLQKQLRWSFEDYEVAVADDQESALVQLAKTRPQVVLLDLGLPPAPAGPSAGMAILQALLPATPTTTVIMKIGSASRR